MANPYPQLELDPTSNAVTLLDPLSRTLIIIKKEAVVGAEVDGTNIHIFTEAAPRPLLLNLFTSEAATAVWIDICRQHAVPVLWVREADGWVRR